MDWIMGVQVAIDYIENHLTEKIDYDMVAAECYSSKYHFQRVFSILCGFTVGEYIRNRRLSLAGTELATSSAKVIDVALKYGYESPDSFAKAFQKFHGILPSQARNNGNNLKSFSRLVLKKSLEGGTIMNYRIEDQKAFSVLGHKVWCGGSPTNPVNAHEKTKEHWLANKNFIKDLKQLRAMSDIWYDIYTDFGYEEFAHIIAIDHPESYIGERYETITIPTHKYAVFQTKQCESPDDEWLPLMQRIVSEWLPASEYQLSNHPHINKLFFGSDHSKRYMEIWLPIEKR